MCELISQDCPLCNVNADYCYVDAENRKYFNCPQCGYFQISWRAEQLLADKSSDYREELSRQAKQAPENHLLTILIPNTSDSVQNPNVSLKAQYDSKSELPLR